jgi:hypothetical protein
MRKNSVNTFTDGLVADLNPNMSRQSFLKKAENIDIISKSGDMFVLQKRGANKQLVWVDPQTLSEEEVRLSEGFEPIAVEESRGIAYIISFNRTTGETEIGTYPSPNYAYIEFTGPVTIDTPVVTRTEVVIADAPGGWDD